MQITDQYEDAYEFSGSVDLILKRCTVGTPFREMNVEFSHLYHTLANMITLYATFTTKDVRTNELVRVNSGMRSIELSAVDVQDLPMLLVRYCHKIFIDLITHEADEAFLYKNEPIYNPHRNLVGSDTESARYESPYICSNEAVTFGDPSPGKTWLLF